MKRSLHVTLTMVIGVWIAFPSHAAGPYRITDLGDLPGGANSSVARGINNLGHVVGGSTSAQGGRAFLWTPAGGMQDLGVLPGASHGSEALDINDRGEVVGYSSGDNQYRAFHWTEAAGMQEQGFWQAWGINASGQVAGVGPVGPFDGALHWDKALGIQNLGVLPGRRNSIATDINASGQVAGGSWTDAPARAFLWTDGVGMLDLGDLPGGLNSSHAWAVNDSGHVVGASSHALNPLDPTGFIQPHHAFLWTPERGMEDLGALPGEVDYSEAYDINNHGQVVGLSAITISRDPPGPHHAFIWTRTEGMQNLNNLLDASGAGWTLGGAFAINDAGQIVGGGFNPDGFSHAFLLTPIPEPSALLLMASGFASLAAAVLCRLRRPSVRPP